MHSKKSTAITLSALTLMTVTACDFDVSNPGPTGDHFLDSLNAHEAVVVGARAAVSDAMENISYWVAAMAFEINPAGSTGSFGIPTFIQAGRFDESLTGDWNDIQEGRWVSEDALRRFEEVLPQIDGAPDFTNYELAAQASVWAGYANRILGENFCQVVFDQPDGTPGGPQPHTDAFIRAEGLFDQAITIAGNVGNAELEDAARAGRAQVRALLARYGQRAWSDVTADASQIADDFVYVLPYSDQDQDQFNRIHFANGNEPYRAHTVWSTWVQDYFTTTGDPRVPWEVGVCPDCPDPSNPTGDAAVAKFGGLVPWYTQLKYDERSSPINLATGWEMRLLEAEAALVDRDVPGAVALMNDRIADLNTQSGVTIPTVTASTVQEGYTALLEQRQYELWLEARRLGDIRSWLENGIVTVDQFLDGVWQDTNDDGVNDTRTEDLTTRHRAWPIGQSEREVNPNVPLAPAFCTP